MTRQDAANVMEKVFDELRGLREAGQKEYAHADDNCFANFERVATEAGVSREMALWVYFLKHKDGVASYLKGHRSQRENVRGRLNDMMVYLCLLRAMIDESEAQAGPGVTTTRGLVAAQAENELRRMKASGGVFSLASAQETA